MHPVIKKSEFVCQSSFVQCREYLQRIFRLRNARYTIYYQDVTRCNVNHTRECVWQKEHKEKSLIEDSIWKGGLKVSF